MKSKPITSSNTPRSVSRRELLEWLGSTTVLALGADLVAGCSALEDELSIDEMPVYPGSGQSCPPAFDFPFQPDEGVDPQSDVLAERTVDPQYLQWILNNWRLQVDGLVTQPADLSFADLLALGRQDQITDFHCVEGWSVLDVPWNGIHFDKLFELVEPLASATHVSIHTIGERYNESIPLEVAREPKTLLAFGIDCATLPLRHGFPLRLIVPRKYGYKSAKYVVRIELDDKAIGGYWEQRGYPYDGDVPADRLRPGKY